MCERMEMHWLQTFVEYERRQCRLHGKAQIVHTDDDWRWVCWCREWGTSETWEGARWELEAHMFEGEHNGEKFRAKVAGRVDSRDALMQA